MQRTHDTVVPCQNAEWNHGITIDGTWFLETVPSHSGIMQRRPSQIQTTEQDCNGREEEYRILKSEYGSTCSSALEPYQETRNQELSDASVNARTPHHDETRTKKAGNNNVARPVDG